MTPFRLEKSLNIILLIACTCHLLFACSTLKALCEKSAHLQGAEGTPPILTDEDGIVAFLREDFLGGTKEAASAADAFLHGVALFRKWNVEHFGG